MPRIFDLIIFDDQLDELEARMRALEGVPGLVHVICEALADFQGNPKPAHFRDNIARFFPWHGRWNHVLVEAHEISGDTPAGRKASLTEFVLHGFHGDPGDILLHGDITDIPGCAALEQLARGKAGPPARLGSAMCCRRRDIRAVKDMGRQ